MSDLNELTILLQGVINDETFKLWIKNYKDYNVILSVWEDSNIELYDIPKNWEVITNQYPLIRFKKTANFDYQLISTINGLKKVKTNWVIKARTDEYYSNLNLFFEKMKQNSEKIVTSSMFFRKWGLYKFHCSDKIIGGTADNLKRMFNKAVENITNNVWDTPIPESQLGLAYVMSREPNLNLKGLTPNAKMEFDSDKTFKDASKAIDISAKRLIEIVHKNMNPKSFSWDFMENQLVYVKNVITDALSYISIRHYTQSNEIDDVSYMKKWFDIVDINVLKPYIATRNVGDKIGRIWYRDNFDNEENDCLTKIN
jgi:hypothetical protein